MRGKKRQHLRARQIFRIKFPLPLRVLKTRCADPGFHVDRDEAVIDRAKLLSKGKFRIRKNRFAIQVTTTRRGPCVFGMGRCISSASNRGVSGKRPALRRKNQQEGNSYEKTVTYSGP